MTCLREKVTYLCHVQSIMHSCSFSLTWQMKKTLLYHTWKFVFKAYQSPNNLKANPYGLHCPQPNSRGSCPLINLACPSAKHWIRLQDCCIIQHIAVGERGSLWSGVTLLWQSSKAREMEKDEREKWKWWKGSWGWEEETERGGEGGWCKRERERNKVRD